MSISNDQGGEAIGFDVCVEIPRGQRNKYEVDHETGRIRLDRTLFTSTLYPADYGFVVDTLGLDGDPLDALVLVDEPTFPGCYIHCRPIAALQMTDEAGPDTKILCVPLGDPRYGQLRDLEDLDEFRRLEIQHFFEEYKAIEPGKHVEHASWAGRPVAEREITEARARLLEHARDSTRHAGKGPTLA